MAHRVSWEEFAPQHIWEISVAGRTIARSAVRMLVIVDRIEQARKVRMSVTIVSADTTLQVIPTDPDWVSVRAFTRAFSSEGNKDVSTTTEVAGRSTFAVTTIRRMGKREE